VRTYVSPSSIEIVRGTGNSILLRPLKLWETVGMPKRNLRIIKRVKNVPVIGICESCKVEFQAEHQPAGQQSRAQAVIQQQFNAHKCVSNASGQAVAGKNS
jgi:hypothetical protein